ncbi:YncE family protein [Dokdonella soli]|uniref:YncE family protein n=1 Tax=Dokdonella soli TaxID=529810 RepID=A0ABN1IYM9_9GAMM
MSKTLCFIGTCLAVACAMSVASAKDAAAPAYAVSAHWNVGGPGGWDYLAVDEAGQRLFVTRGDRVAVLDLANGKSLGQVGPTNGVHGVALAPSLGKGYASNGKGDSVTVFDLKTLATTATIAIEGHNPDAIVFDAPTARVLTFNGRSHDATVIDAKTERPIATIALSGRPEFAVSDGNGRLYLNIEDRGELTAIDTKSAKVIATWPLKDCEEPSGLALDAEHGRLFSVCQNDHMIVTDARTGHHVASVAIGKGPDAVAFDAERHLVFSSNGDDGTLTIVRQQSADRYEVLANLPTQHSARTLALDPRSHRVFLAAAEFEPLPEKHEPHQRPAMKADTFAVLVVGPAGTP